MKTNIAIALLLWCSFCIAQPGHRPQVDTTDLAFRDKLKLFYLKRTQQTALGLQNLPDRKLSRSALESYKELNGAIISKMDQDYFVPAPYYEQRIDALLHKISASNPQFPALAATRILLSFSEEPNAFAIGDGIVVVNLPLLAKIGNEYELAFVICHELGHNLSDHTHKGLMEYAKTMNSKEVRQQTREIDRQRYNKGQNAAGLYRKIVYGNRKKQREVEFEADSLGLVLFRNAFSGKEPVVLKGFETLDHMDKVTDSLAEDDYVKLFSTARQPFKQEWLKADETSMYKYDKTVKFWQVDSLKTHPDCSNRADRLKRLFELEDKTVSLDSDYQQVSKNAAYDHLLGLYRIKEYGKSLYQTLLLLKKDPSDAFLRRMVFLNLKQIQQAQRSYTMNKYVETVNPRYPLSYNTFLSFLRQLRKSEMAELINLYTTPI